MNFLLDTHTFLFSVFGTPKLGKKAEEAILDTNNTIFVSAVSFWEISLKYSLGKLDLVNIAPDDLPHISLEMGFTLLILSPEDAAAYHRLERSGHNDPFDRMLIWQAIRKNYILISKDAGFKNYAHLGLRVIW
jgi:PIN domain nuclease of toxin-antitoxin system